MDGETNLKIKVALKKTDEILTFDDWENSNFRNFIKSVDKTKFDCEAPNNRLNKFKGTYRHETDKIQISNENVLLRGTVLRNCEMVLGVVVYAGKESKLMKNGGEEWMKILKTVFFNHSSLFKTFFFEFSTIKGSIQAHPYG